MSDIWYIWRNLHLCLGENIHTQYTCGILSAIESCMYDCETEQMRCQLATMAMQTLDHACWRDVITENAYFAAAIDYWCDDLEQYTKMAAFDGLAYHSVARHARKHAK